MKFICDKVLLQEALTAASRASTTNSPNMMLANLLLIADEGLTVVGNNLEISIEYTVPAQVRETGSICINSRTLCDIVRSLPDEAILFEETDKNIHITCGETDFKLIGLSAEDFPRSEPVEDAVKTTMSAEMLTDIVRQTGFAVAVTDVKPLLTGIKFEISPDNITAVALDGYRLALRREAVESGAEVTCIIPGRSMGELCRILKDEDDVSIELADAAARFRFGSCLFTTRLLQGEFINYNNIIPTSVDSTAVIGVPELMKCVERAALLADHDGSKIPVKLTFQGPKLHVTCETQSGQFHDVLNVETTNMEEFEIGFNHKFLLDALRATECESVRMEFTGSIKPLVIKPMEGNEFIFIVLPVRLK